MSSRRLYHLLYISLLLSFLNGCGPKSSLRTGRRVVATASLDVVEESVVLGESIRPSVPLCEARLVDVPIPLGAHLAQATDDGEGSSFISYHTSMPLAELERFYLQQMEQMGWQQLINFHGPEQLIIFERPDRKSAVSLRPHSDGGASDVTIFAVTNTDMRTV